MAIYWIYLIIAFILPTLLKQIRDRKYKTHYIVIMCIMYIVISGFRAESVGADLLNYHNRYNNAEYILFRSVNASLEFGFNFVLYLFKRLNLGFRAFVIFMSAFIGITYYRFIHKYSADDALSVIMFFTIGLLSMSLSTLRQMCAICIGLIGIELLQKNKKILFLIFIALGYTFHNSALVMLLFLLPKKLFNTNAKRWIWFVACSSALLFAPLIIRIVSRFAPTRYSHIDYEGTYFINILRILVAIAIAFFCTAAYWKEKEPYPVECMMFTSTYFYVLFLVMAYHGSYFARIAEYFSTSTIILVPSAIVKLGSKKNKMIATTIIVAFCLLYFVVGTYGGTRLKMGDYRFFWQE